MSKRIFIVVVLAAFAVCAVAVAQQRKVIDEARFGTVEVKRTHSHVIKPARTLVVPWHINYQGYLTDDVGNPINDTLSMTFGIWDDPGVGSELWNENGNVVVEEGLFNVVLGSTTPIPSDVFGAGQSRWLELTVELQTLSPRTEITSVGYAYRAVKADSADDAGMVDGFDASPTPGSNDLFPLSAGDVRYVNEGQTDAITSDMILDGTIARGDAEAAFKAPYADTADYALAANVGYVDSAGVSANSWRLENNTLMNLDSRWVNENQVNAITSSMILDGQVGTSDLGDLSVATQKIGDDAVTSGKIFDGTIVRTDVDAAFKAPYADTADYALDANVAYVDSAGVSANSWRLENNTLMNLDSRWVNENQVNAITSSMILDGQVGTSDLGDLSVATQKIGNDAVTTLKIFDGAVVNSKVANDAVTSAKIFDGTIVRGDVEVAFKAPYSDTADYALGAPASPDNDWTIAGSVLYPSAAYGLAMRSFNVLYGVYDTTHVNLGIACTTGTSGQDRGYCTVSGGYNNSAGYDYATVGGGSSNMASGYHGTVSGGENSSATGQYAVVGGGRDNTAGSDGAAIGGGGMNTINGSWAVVGGGWANAATGYLATVGGGTDNTASAQYATVSGGDTNTASGDYATVGGGTGNTASGNYATVGGWNSTASGQYATVGGGWGVTASGIGATVGGGRASTSAGNYSFTVGQGSYVPAAHSNSAAFNGQTTTASGQTRVGTISKAAGTFTIDHPLDPMNKVLNHYFVESPEMVLIYRGVGYIGGDGRAQVHLPDYFDALNRNPMVQLTGVGTSEVFVAEEVNDNRFVIGGKPGTKVYWTVTGDRKDQSAEITRIIMPVEQAKDGDLAGRSLDDDFLATTKAQLEEMGQAGQFHFRTQRGREKYEGSQRRLSKNR